MYWKKTFVFRDSREIEITHAGRYGAKGERRLPKKKATPEQIQKQNQKNKEKRMRRLIKANFEEGDFFLTLKYFAGTRKPLEEVEKDLKRFIRSMRTAYRKRMEEMKYIYRIEIGRERGGIHIHMILNRIADTDKLVRAFWQQGIPSFEQLYKSGGFKALAEYITKPVPQDIVGQLSLFDKAEKKKLVKYSTSRNLIRPEPIKKAYIRLTVRRILENGPQATKGFYIDKDSIEIGVNPVTGYSYIHYTELRLERTRDG